MKFPKGIRQFFEQTGKKGGKRRAKNLSAKRRKQIAKRAARARWSKKGKRR